MKRKETQTDKQRRRKRGISDKEKRKERKEATLAEFESTERCWEKGKMGDTAR